MQVSTGILSRRDRREGRLQYILAVLLLQLDVLLPSPNRVDEGEFHQASEDETGATQEPDFRSLDVANLGEGFTLGRSQRDERQHRAGSERYPRSRLVRLKPKGDPRNCDQHNRWDEVVHQVESHFSGQVNGKA